LGVKTPPLMEIFFNFLGFFEKKIPKYPLNFAVYIKNSKYPLKNFLITLSMSLPSSYNSGAYSGRGFGGQNPYPFWDIFSIC